MGNSKPQITTTLTGKLTKHRFRDIIPLKKFMRRYNKMENDLEKSEIGSVLSDRQKKLGFLHKVCQTVNHTSMAYWIDNDEFNSKITVLMSNGSCIDEKMVFDIMKEIYIMQENIKSANKTSDFNFYLARRGIESIWASLSGSKSGWRD